MAAHNRVAPGLRVSLHLLMVRPIIRTREDFIGRIPQAVLDRNPRGSRSLHNKRWCRAVLNPGI